MKVVTVGGQGKSWKFGGGCGGKIKRLLSNSFLGSLTMVDHGQPYCNLTFMVDQGQTMVISLPWYITTMDGNRVQSW